MPGCILLTLLLAGCGATAPTPAPTPHSPLPTPLEGRYLVEKLTPYSPAPSPNQEGGGDSAHFRPPSPPGGRGAGGEGDRSPLLTPHSSLPTPHSSPLLFDDFAYSDQAAFAGHGWTVRTKPGWPGVAGATWGPEGVSFLDDPEQPGNRLVRLTAATAGAGANTRQAQICQQRKFLAGTYATRVRFTDQPASGPDGDAVVESFYSLSTLDAPLDPNYSELDDEYLPNGGWGVKGPMLYVTSWETFRPEPNWQADNLSQHLAGSQAGWHTLVTQVAAGQVRYYLDGRQLAEHGEPYYPESPMSLNFNVWFIGNGLLAGQQERQYHEDIDWVFHQANTLLSPGEIETQVQRLRQAALPFVDTVPALVPPLPPVCGL